MKKQVISIAAAVTMLAAAMPGALAKTYPSADSQWVFSSRDGKGTYEISTAEAYSGDSSLYIDAQGGSGAKLFMATNQPGNYDISFYLKEVSYGWSSGLRVASSGSWAAENSRWFDGSGWTKTPVGNGWVKYEGSYWNEDTPNGCVIYFAEGGKYYIDDLSVVHVSGTKIIDDFEKGTETNDDIASWYTSEADGGSFSEVEEANGNHCWKLTGPGQIKRKVRLPISNVVGPEVFKFKAKITGNPSAIYFGVNNEARYNIVTWSKTDLEDGWAEYNSGELGRWLDPPPSSWDFQLWIPYNSTGVEMLIDDISVSVQGSPVLFEDCEPSVRYDYTEELASLSANGNSNNIVLTWRNPNRSDITGFKVYEGNTEIDTSAITFSTAAYALNTVTIAPGDDNVHTYRVDMTAGGKTYSTTVSGKRSNGTGNTDIVSYLNPKYTKDGYSLEGAEIACWKGGDTWAQLPYGSVAIDTKNKYSGNSSLRINPNYAGSNWDSGIRFYMQVPNISQGKTYKVTYMEKYDHKQTSGDWVSTTFDNPWNANGGMPSDWTSTMPFVKNTDGTYNTKWHQREFTFDGGSGRLFFTIPGAAANVWLDDIEVYELDAEGNATGSNLVVNGGFEYKLDSLDLNGSTLTWSVPAGANYDRIDIVTTANGQTETYTVNPADGTYTLPAFTGSKQTIVVNAVRMLGETAYTTKCGTFERTNDYYIAPATYDEVTKNEDDTYTAVETGIANTVTGLIRSNVTVENNNVDSLAIDVFTAVYNTDGRLTGVTMTSETVAKGTKQTVSSVLSADAANTMKTFVFTGGTITPETPASVLNPVAAE